MFGGDTLAGFRDRTWAVLTGDLKLDRALSTRLCDEAADRLRRGGADALTGVRARLAEWDIDAQWAVLATEERPRAIAERVEPYLRGATLVLGCGDGSVGERLFEMDCPVFLCDDHHVRGGAGRLKSLPFAPVGAASGLPVCETVLVTPAAGCDEDPLDLLRLATDTRASRVVLVVALLEKGCPEEVHALFQLFASRCLGEEGCARKGATRTLEEWVSELSRLGTIAAIERWASVPGLPLPHGLFAVDLARGEGRGR